MATLLSYCTSLLFDKEASLLKCLKYPESVKVKDKTYSRQITRGCWGCSLLP